MGRIFLYSLSIHQSFLFSTGSANLMHYRKICLFRAFLLCREQTHGKETFAVSRHGQPTAKLDDTAQLTTAHGEPAAHGRLRQRLTAKQATR
jgi:hypothetical protein